MNSSLPLVSIITPFFNASRFLAEALESAISQTYPNWQLLLINDGSTDASSEIACDYAKSHADRIFYLTHDDRKNHGLLATLNLGFQHSRGEYRAFLHSDDVWFPCKLEEQVALIQGYPNVGMVFGRSEYWYDWSGHPCDAGRNTTPELAPGDRLYYPPELLKISYPLGRFGVPCPTNLLVRGAVIDDVGKFDEQSDPRPPWEDIAFMTKVFLHYPVYVSDECWDRYRRHSESIWSIAQANGDEAKGRVYYFSWLREYLVNAGVADDELWRLYRKSTWEYRHPRISRAIRAARRRARPLKRYLIDLFAKGSL